MRWLTILITISLFLMACGGGKPGPAAAVDYAGKLTAKIKVGAMTTEKVIELNEKKGLFESFKSSVGYKSQQVDVIFHQITIGNFEFKAMNDEPTQKGQTMVKITLFAEKGAKASDAIKVGTYEAFKSEDVTNAYLKVGDVSIINFDESKESNTIGSQGARTGSVKIESVENNIVKGTIDLSAGDSKKLAGNFTATLMK